MIKVYEVSHLSVEEKCDPKELMSTNVETIKKMVMRYLWIQFDAFLLVQVSSYHTHFCKKVLDIGITVKCILHL